MEDGSLHFRRFPFSRGNGKVPSVPADVSWTDAPDHSARVFATTHWSVVVSAGDSQSPEASWAMERLCRSYWYPLYAFVRRRGYGHEDASDLTQAFFAKLLEKNYLQTADASRGRFRTFLLTALMRFLNNEWEKSRTQRRGGGARVLSLDDASADARYWREPVDGGTPERLFERRWAETVLEVALDRLAGETERGRFEVLKGFLIEEKGTVSYDEAAAALRVSVAAVTSAIHRMRVRFRVLMFEEVANTVDRPDQVEPELRHLLAALYD